MAIIFKALALKMNRREEEEEKNKMQDHFFFGVSHTQKHQKRKITYDKMKNINEIFSIRIYEFGCFHMRSDLLYIYIIFGRA